MRKWRWEGKTAPRCYHWCPLPTSLLAGVQVFSSTSHVPQPVMASRLTFYWSTERKQTLGLVTVWRNWLIWPVVLSHNLWIPRACLVLSSRDHFGPLEQTLVEAKGWMSPRWLQVFYHPERLIVSGLVYCMGSVLYRWCNTWPETMLAELKEQHFHCCQVMLYFGSGLFRILEPTQLLQSTDTAEQVLLHISQKRDKGQSQLASVCICRGPLTRILTIM